MSSTDEHFWAILKIRNAHRKGGSSPGIRAAFELYRWGKPPKGTNRYENTRIPLESVTQKVHDFSFFFFIAHVSTNEDFHH
jgi:hypothetical protein